METVAMIKDDQLVHLKEHRYIFNDIGTIRPAFGHYAFLEDIMNNSSEDVALTFYIQLKKNKILTL